MYYAFRKAVVGAVLLACSTTCLGDVVTDWNRIALEAIKNSKYVSTSASRCLAMVHGAAYDAVNAIERTHQPYIAALNAHESASAEAAAAMAAYRVLRASFPAQADFLDSAIAASLSVVADGPDKENGVRLGNDAADAMLAWRSHDYSMHMVPYTPGSAPGQWRPTPPMNAPAMMPHWAEVTPFAMKKNSQFRSQPPPPLPSVIYARAFNEVKKLGAKDSPVRTPEQTAIAQFWADMPGTETTVGRWNLIAQSVAQTNTLAQNARMFALLNIAMADAGIAAWDCKYAYSFWRPITAIREADTDKNRRTAPDPDWEPLLITPAFPEYNSAHSCFSAAAARMLANYFGSDRRRFQVLSYYSDASVRSYGRFSEAAFEAGMSRIYGGIHYRFSDTTAQIAGRRLSDYVWRSFMRPVRNAQK